MKKLEILLDEILCICEKEQITVSELVTISHMFNESARMSEIGCKNETKFRTEMNSIGTKINSDSEKASRKLLGSPF